MTEKEYQTLKEEILKEYAKDTRKENSTLRVVALIAGIIALIMVIGFIVLAVHTQKVIAENSKHTQDILAENARYTADKMAELLSEYDWEVEYEIETLNNDNFSGNIIMER